MALRDQPYIPLYVQDFLTDEKLNECSAASQGVYIKIMCILHKQEDYGKILLRQKDQQNASKIKNFACKFAKLLPFDVDVIESALIELIDEKVLTVDGDTLYQKRMVRDGTISTIRSKAASSKSVCYSKSDSKIEAKATAKASANSEYEYEDVNDTDNDTKSNEDTVKKTTLDDTRFESFWKAYPKKSGKKKAQESWKRIKVTEELYQKILSAIEQAKISDQWKRDNGQFIPFPATWLNQGRWDDEYVISASSAGSNWGEGLDEIIK